MNKRVADSQPEMQTNESSSVQCELPQNRIKQVSSSTLD